MPSKKKHSKVASRLSKTDQSASPHTPALTSPSKFEVNEQDHALLLEEASHIYPLLIGTSAFVGHLTDIVVEQELTRRGTIWLSESAMVASSCAPGCVVSVCLPASGTRSSNIFPLSSISGEYNRQFGTESMDEKTNEVGNHFALARVSHSSKVLKDGVRLSADLSYTMGCPALGTVVFVYTVRKPTSMGLEDGNKKSCNLNDDNMSFHNCNELHLELVSFTDRVNGRNNVTSTLKLPSENTCDQSENGIVSSPQTPPCKSMLSSPSTSQIASSRCEKSISTSSRTHLDFLDIKEVLKDESMQHFHQAWVATRLHSRILICGNLVAIPMLRYHFIFRVISANKLPASTSQEPMKEVGPCSYPQTPKSVDCVKDAFLIDCETTKVHLYPPMHSTTESPKKGLPVLQVESKHLITKEGQDILKLGGLDKEYAMLKDLVASSMKNTLSSLGIRTTKGVLLHGPPGTGKTSLAQLCTHDAGVNLFSVNGPEIISQYYGESEQQMHKVFDSASQAAPSVVFIDELDAIAPARKDGSEELSQRMVATLLNLMDGINKTDGLLVIAATNRPDSIEPALRRPGRFDREIEIGVPSPQQRLDILHSLLGEVDHALSDMQIQHLAMVTHGFVGADLAALVNEAALVCLRRYNKSLKSGSLWHPRQSYIANGGCSDGLVIRSNCLSERGGVLSDFADSSTSNVLDLPISLEIQPSSLVNSTVTGSADNFEEATSCKDVSSVVKDFMFKVAFEDFNKARMKVRPSAMREV
uniref:Calmodulin-interacting protein 111 isoform X1 n=1 Tax=Rhizophora mucronata TaxID=61149 RepID=A0A2P2LBI6_RHIMU